MMPTDPEHGSSSAPIGSGAKKAKSPFPLPLHIVISFLAVHVVAFDVIVRCALSDGHIGRFVTATAAAGLAFGATAAMCRRTWGVGLMLAAATSFLVAGALGMGPPYFFVVAAIGTAPFLFTMKYMARFHLGATILFALLAGLLGTSASLMWGAVAPSVIQYTQVMERRAHGNQHAVPQRVYHRRCHH